MKSPAITLKRAISPALGLLTMTGALLWAPGANAAVSMTLCTTWRVNYTDANHGETYQNQTGYQDVPAYYGKYKITNKDTGVIEYTGWLNNNGCTPSLSLESQTPYKFSQGTAASAGSGVVYVQYSSSPDWGERFTWLNNHFTTTTTGGTINFTPTYYNAYSNLSGSASMTINSASSRYYPSGTYTYYWPKDWTGSATTAYVGDGHIQIDTNFTQLDPNNPQDHSTYKFAVAHEMGHRIADAVDGPLHAQYGSYSSVPKCNCDHFDGNYDDMCFQSREYTGTAQSEAWAYFYATALYNSRGANNCRMGYFRAMYDANGDLDTDAPVTVDCSTNAKWMESNGCTAEHRGVLQDWLAFYWDLWTVPQFQTFSMQQIAEVWAEADVGDALVGPRWSELVDAVVSKFGTNSPYYSLFVNKGDTSGVDH